MCLPPPAPRAPPGPGRPLALALGGVGVTFIPVLMLLCNELAFVLVFKD